MSVIGAFNFLGNNWDVKGPMLFTMRVDYLNDKTAAQVLDADRERARRRFAPRASREAELAQAKTALRSASSRTWKAAFMPRFGRANLLGGVCAVRRRPAADQHDSRRSSTR